MIPYIDTQLNMWAAWRAVGNCIARGYPRCAAFLATAGGRGGQVDLSDGAAADIDRAVSKLPADQKAVVMRVYVHMRSYPAESIARDLGCARDTLYARLHRAHVAILESLQDIEIARIAAH